MNDCGSRERSFTAAGDYYDALSAAVHWNRPSSINGVQRKAR